jgi:hypothetical protein
VQKTQTSALSTITPRRRADGLDPSSGTFANEYCGKYAERMYLKHCDVRRVISLTRIAYGGSLYWLRCWPTG